MFEPLNLISNKKEWMIVSALFLSILFISLSYEYLKYKNFKYEEIYFSSGKIINIHKKKGKDYNILKIKTSNFVFFTSSNEEFINNTHIEVKIITKNIDFLHFIKRFYAPTFSIYKIDKITIKDRISQYIENQHQNKDIASLFNALFLAYIPTSLIKEGCINFGISHLIAISGFHLGIFGFVLFQFINLFYSYFHNRYFPYRNKRFDILIIVSTILFLYLILTDVVPSLLRAFVMSIVALLFLRSNIKILSFKSLFLITMFIISLFPNYLFSLSLWFSLSGVFFIFLYIEYFKDSNKYLSFIFFNIWIFLALNPISHLIFPQTSYFQLLSPLFTVGFTIFYPLEFILHIIGFGDILDKFILMWLDIKISCYEITTPLYIFIAYIMLAFLAIKYRVAFYLLNILLFWFNFKLYFIIS